MSAPDMAAEVAAELATADDEYRARAAELVEAKSLEMLDPAQREAAVTRYLSDARDQLAIAVKMSGPEAVAALKAEIATAAEATRQLNLSKEIQSDAQEMVRRAEYALGKAIRAGQERGEVRRRGQGGGQPPWTETPRSDKTLSAPQDYATHSELAGQGAQNNGIYGMTDGVSESEFDAALADAKSEGNLSRANVVRRIRAAKKDALTPGEKLTKIRELAPTGRTSAQIGTEIGTSEDYVRRAARENDIQITADEVLRGTRRVRIDHDHIVNHLVSTLEGLVDGLDRVDLDALDDAQMQYWADSLTHTTRALNRFAKQIKERAQ